jgi:hypothetical protein
MVAALFGSSLICPPMKIWVALNATLLHQIMGEPEHSQEFFGARKETCLHKGPEEE